MELPPSKLSDAASRLWSESAGQFHKKTDLKIDLGLEQQKIHPPSGAEDKASISISAGYVFGSRVSERVTKSDSCEPNSKQQEQEAATSSSSSSVSKPLDVSSIFKRIAEKGANSKANATNMWKTSSSSSFTNGSVGLMESSLKESAKELARKSSQVGLDSEKEQQQDIKTGEEDERNLLHVNCKFYQYNTETKVWQERGMGSLRINQHIDARDEVRLVGRQSGNQRVLINSKIFPEMILEELSDKRLKISAQVNESKVPQLFIVQASPASIATLQNMLQKYIDASSIVKATTQCHLHMRKRRLEKAVEEDGEAANDEGLETTEPTKKFIPEETEDEQDGKGKEADREKGEEEEGRKKEADHNDDDATDE